MKLRPGLEFSMVVTTVIIFLLVLFLNESIFIHSEFVRGINWVYLPAGVRLLCTLLFGGAGAIGLLIASWLSCVYYYFPDDPVRSAVGSLISAGAPYLVYLYARHTYGLRASLSNLGPQALLVCAMAYALANSLLHHIWFLASGDTADWASGFAIMLIGDLAGSLLVLYTMKMGFHLVPRLLFR